MTVKITSDDDNDNDANGSCGGGDDDNDDDGDDDNYAAATAHWSLLSPTFALADDEVNGVGHPRAAAVSWHQDDLDVFEAFVLRAHIQVVLLEYATTTCNSQGPCYSGAPL